MKNYYLLILSCLLTQHLSAQAPGIFNFNITSPSSIVQSLSPGEFGIAESNGTNDWGWDGSIPEEFYGEMAFAPEGIDGQHFYCEEDVTDFSGKVVLIKRGSCYYSQKALNAQNQGAIAVVIQNFEETVNGMAPLPFGEDVTIPVIMVPKSIGDELIFELLNGATVIVGFTNNPYMRVEGTVIRDENMDCLNTPGETVLQGWKIHTTSTNVYSNLAYADTNGQYELFLDTGTYEVELIPPHFLWESCPAVTVSSSNFDTLTVDLKGQDLVICPIMSVDIVIPFLRRCFDDNRYKVYYCNLGTGVGEAAYVTVQFDELISIVSSDLPYTELADNTYEFLLGDVEPNECGNFSIYTAVSCDAELEQTLCAFANIYPQLHCDTGGGSYVGPSVKVKGSCTEDEVSFQIENNGVGNMDTPSDYTVFKNNVILETGSFQLAAGASTGYNFVADGATYRLEAAQASGYPEASSPSFTIEACEDDLGNFDTGYFNMFPPADYGLTYDEECTRVRGAWDPNDKTPTPLGYGDEHFIERNTDIHYLIRFQNTGTDTAFNVIVRDTLSSSFDMLSLDIGVASHDYTVRVFENNVLEFKFMNIMLPDSNVNEAASHGYLSYQLRQKDNLALGTVIRNSAAIYFDFNEPIITNETFHTIGEDFIGTTNLVALDNNISIQVYPNPMNEYVIFNLQNIVFQKGHLELFNSIGQLVRVENIHENYFEVKRKGLNEGTYFFKLSLDNKLAATGMIQVLGIGE